MKRTSVVILTAGLVLLMAGPVFTQVPSALPKTTNQKSTSGGRFSADVDYYMETKGWGGITFDRHFFFIGGQYMAQINPALGYATKFGDYYLGLYYRGTVVQGNDTTHNNWDSSWDKDNNGSSKFTLNDNVAVLFGVPNIGGFRFDWIASDSSGSLGPVFEKFKGENRTYNGESIDAAEGNSAGSMSFILSYGNEFAQKVKVDAVVGFATPNSLTVTGGQVGAEIFKFTQTDSSKIYVKLGGGYNLPGASSVDADYSLIVSPGEKWEQTKGTVHTSKTAEGNIQHIINVNYSKTINWDDKITMKIKPNINFDILSEQEVYETESGKVDNGKQTTLKIIPTAAVGIQYKATERLALYAGTTITLFDFAAKNGEKGADGASYGDGTSSSDIIQGSQTGFDIGSSFALTETLTLDFNARTLIKSIFVAQSPTVDLYLTFKK
ncbi:MAG: hypothetical protein LBQ14_11540 [Treponema sp.]|jgi:hypothetical protein|nr:hypothetical protein [Treponema sp.]